MHLGKYGLGRYESRVDFLEVAYTVIVLRYCIQYDRWTVETMSFTKVEAKNTMQYNHFYIFLFLILIELLVSKFSVSLSVMLNVSYVPALCSIAMILWNKGG